MEIEVYIKPVCEYAKISPAPYSSTTIPGTVNQLWDEPTLLDPLFDQPIMSLEKFTFEPFVYEFKSLWAALSPSEDVCEIKYTLEGLAVAYLRFQWDRGLTFANTTTTMQIDSYPIDLATLTINSAPVDVIFLGTNTVTLTAEYSYDPWNPNWPNVPLLTPR